MPLNADFMRLRAPCPKHVTEMLEHRPMLLKGAQLAQPALMPGHSYPIKVAVWDSEPDHIHKAAGSAVGNWNEAMAKHTAITDGLFRVVAITDPWLDLVVGTKPFDIPFDPEAEFGTVAMGAYLGRHTFGRPFGTPNAELGDCEHVWNEHYEVFTGHHAGRIFVPDDIKHRRTLASLVGHELGHGALEGHSPSTPSHIMYRYHTDVTRPKKAECLVAEEIWV